MDIPLNYVAIGETIRFKSALKAYNQYQATESCSPAITGSSVHYYSKIEREKGGKLKFKTLYGIAIASSMSLDVLLENIKFKYDYKIIAIRLNMKIDRFHQKKQYYIIYNKVRFGVHYYELF